MRTVETDWWLLDLPEEWEAEQDEETIVISDQDGIGALEITRLEVDASSVELQALAAQWLPQGVKGAEVRKGDFDGLYFAYDDEDDAVREWLLCAGEIYLLVSYACDPENAGMDDEVIDEILDTLSLNTSGGE
jgi:hypothetical protein